MTSLDENDLRHLAQQLRTITTTRRTTTRPSLLDRINQAADALDLIHEQEHK